MPTDPKVAQLWAERGDQYKANAKASDQATAALMEDAQLPDLAPRPSEMDLFGKPTGFAEGKRVALSRIAKRNLRAARAEMEREGHPLLLLFYSAMERLQSGDKGDRQRGEELLLELLPYVAAKRVAVATADVTPGSDQGAALRAYLASMGGAGYVQPSGAAPGGAPGGEGQADLVDGDA